MHTHTHPTCALLQNQLSGLEGATGMTLLARDRLGRARRVTLTGWTAVAGMAAMVLLVIYAVGWVSRSWRQSHAHHLCFIWRSDEAHGVLMKRMAGPRQQEALGAALRRMRRMCSWRSSCARPGH